jgi:DNA recombination protein RmuC
MELDAGLLAVGALLLGLTLGVLAGAGLGVALAARRGLDPEAREARDRALLELADARFREAGAQTGSVVAPVHEALGRMEAHLRALETQRASAQAGLVAQVRGLAEAAERLRSETATLAGALRSPNARGRWGEMQLRRVVELAGMLVHCDFDEQVALRGAEGTQRPDLVVRLAGGRSVAVDAKVPLAAYLESVDATDPDLRVARLRAHARALRGHVDVLAARDYWAALQPSPELVLLFVPGEAFLAPALEHDPALLDDALGKGVVIATPTTLLALLRTVAWGWQQASLADGAREVVAAGRELHRRLGRFAQHVDKLGRSLRRSVEDYNTTVGALERTLAPAARRLSEATLGDDPTPPAQLDVVPRAVADLAGPTTTVGGDEDAA